MNVRTIGFLIIAFLSGIGVGWVIKTQVPPEGHIAARTAADYLHAVIEADRTFYTQHIVERMEAMLIVTASEDWVSDKTLPLPVQFLREASRSLHVLDPPFRYRLISLWPVNPKNAPVSDLERTMLGQVVKYGEVVEREAMVNQKRYFTAIYPDQKQERS